MELNTTVYICGRLSIHPPVSTGFFALEDTMHRRKLLFGVATFFLVPSNKIELVRVIAEVWDGTIINALRPHVRLLKSDDEVGDWYVARVGDQLIDLRNTFVRSYIHRNDEWCTLFEPVQAGDVVTVGIRFV